MSTWSVAIFSARETVDVLLSTLQAAITASRARPTTIDIVTNGNADLGRMVGADPRSPSLAARLNGRVRIWSVSLADKAHAFNTYLRDIYPDTDVAYFVDGYVRVKPDALDHLSTGLDIDPHAWAAAAVPTLGRSAAVLRDRMLKDGGLHGNLFALRGVTVQELRARGFHLPLGIYRNESLIGAAIMYSLDPELNPWDPKRIRVCPEATWEITPSSLRSLADLRIHWRRMKRQAQGRLENRAVGEHMGVNKRRPESLPLTNAELVGSWIAEHPHQALQLYRRNPLCWLGAQAARHPRDWSGATNPPDLIAEFTAAAGEPSPGPSAS